MDDNENEKNRLLESIRLQDAALSAANDTYIVDSDSDSFDESAETDINKERGSSRISDHPSWAEALEANQEYDAVLCLVEEEIKQNISKIESKLNDIREKIQSVSDSRACKNAKAHWLYPFGMPYFKTHNLFPCPFNQDYLTKRKNNEICWPDLPLFHQWDAPDKRQLSNAVKTLSLKKCRENAQFQLSLLQKELATARAEGNDEKASNLEQNVQSFNVETTAQSMLQSFIENEDHDWMLISAKFLEGKQSPEMCKSFWHLYLHPKINKAPFTKDEEKKLVALVEEYEHQDWDRIAEDLETNRSGYQCFIIYQNKLNAIVKKNLWDENEDAKLCKTVEKYRIGDYIPWGRVTYEMEGRTKAQVFNRWTYSLNPSIKKGRFTEEEDIMILVGVTMWGENFHRISRFLKDRTTSQIRDRYKHYLKRSGTGMPWTIEDDSLLLKLEEQHGKNWVKIAEHFPSKDRTQVRHRFNTVSKWREKNPDAPLSEAPSRCYSSAGNKNFQKQWEKARTVLSCENLEDMVKAKNAIVSSIVKSKKKAIDSRKRQKSMIETDLVNYFRCSYDIPGGHKKSRLFQGEAVKYAEELSVTLSLLKAKLDFPSITEIQQDPTLSFVDKEIFTAFLTQRSDVSEDPLSPFPPETSERVSDQDLIDDESSDPLALFCDIKPPISVPEPTNNIDYTPTHNIASLYIDLPLMDFDNINVVADRNRDPSFFVARPCRSEESDEIEPILTYEDIHTRTTNVSSAVMFPPNLTTLVGMRTYLLNRRNLIQWCTTGESSGKPSKKLREARRRFDERIFSLFLWPALMSRYGPSNNEIFLDGEENEVKSVNGPSTCVKTKSSTVKRSMCSPTQDAPSTSGPPHKKRKVPEQDLGSDPPVTQVV